jgi:outer membrane autotransporter protein
MIGYESNRFAVDELRSDADANTWHVAAYGNWQQDAYRLGFGGAWSRHAIAMNRSLSLFSLTETLTSDYHANTTQIFAEAAYAATSGFFTAEPFARLAYVRSKRDSFDEDATGSIVKTPLHADATDIDNLVTDLGMSLQYQWQLSGDRKLSAVATPSWQHTFGDLRTQSLFSFAPDLAFSVIGAPLASDTISVDLGLTLDLNQDVSIAVNYGGRFGHATAENAVEGLAKLRF